MKNNKHMNNQFYFKRLSRVILISLILLLSLFSCSRQVVRLKDSDDVVLQYKGVNYMPHDSGKLSVWHARPSDAQVEYIETTPMLFAGFPMWSTRPIFATKESPANFLIISYSYDKSVFYSSSAFIREDIELGSETDTVFGDISVRYHINDASEKDPQFENIPNGVSFYDFIGNETEATEKIPDKAKIYCSLDCSHPDIEYVECVFSIYVAEGEYYLELDAEGTRFYYPWNPSW